MNAPTVLIVEGRTTASAMRSALNQRGFAVRTARTIEEALTQDCPDVLVVETELPDGSGHDLVASLRARGGNPRTIFVSARPTIEACRQALLLGAVDFLAKPVRLEELVHAVEKAGQTSPPTRDSEGKATRTRSAAHVFERTFGTTEDDIDTASRELASYLVLIGAGPSCRARLVSAVTELFDNVRRHAYVDAREKDGFRVRVDADQRYITVSVEDWGAGFDTAEVSEYAFESPTHNGFARCACLAEDVRLESHLGDGSYITLRFAAYRVDFDEDDHIDLTELDYLTPELARRVLETLSDDSGDDPFRLSPAMAVAVGRLLTGPDPDKRLRLALWS